MNAAPPPDVTLLLRAHSEQRWLSREVIPVVRQIETGARLPEEQLPAAVAYLEVIWAEAVGLAREADAALRALDALDAIGEGAGSPAWSRAQHPLGEENQPLPGRARRYHASVKELRAVVALRVEVLIAAPVDYADAADRRADALA